MEGNKVGYRTVEVELVFDNKPGIELMAFNLNTLNSSETSRMKWRTLLFWKAKTEEVFVKSLRMMTGFT